MYAAELGSTGAPEMSAFHGLSLGNTGQPLIDPPTVPPLPPLLLPLPELLPDPLPEPLLDPLPLLLDPLPLLLDPLPELLPLPLLLPEPLLLPPSGPTTGLPVWPPLLLLESSPPHATALTASVPVTTSIPKVRMGCDILPIEHDDGVWEQALARSINIPSPPHVSTDSLATSGRVSASSVSVIGIRGKPLRVGSMRRRGFIDRVAFAARHIPGALLLDGARDVAASNDPVLSVIANAQRVQKRSKSAEIRDTACGATWADEHPIFANRASWAIRGYGRERTRVLGVAFAAPHAEDRHVDHELSKSAPGHSTPRATPSLHRAADEVQRSSNRSDVVVVYGGSSNALGHLSSHEIQ